MNITGYYYLHENGELIYKPYHEERVADFMESPFVKMFWGFNSADRSSAWSLLIEASIAGAKKERIKELACKWGCDDADADNFAKYFNLQLSIDGNMKCVTPAGFINLGEDPAGFGIDYLSAFIDLAKNMGYKPQKIWGRSFREILNTVRER